MMPKIPGASHDQTRLVSRIDSFRYPLIAGRFAESFSQFADVTDLNRLVSLLAHAGACVFITAVSER
jgi:hypothetical protein